MNCFNSRLPSKRTRGRFRNMSLQDLKGTKLVQFRPHTRTQAECQSSGSLQGWKKKSVILRKLDIQLCIGSIFVLRQHCGTLKTNRGPLTLHKCKNPGRPKRAAPGLACPGHSKWPNGKCTWGSHLARLQKRRFAFQLFILFFVYSESNDKFRPN